MRRLTRREFLKGAAGTATAAALLGTTVLADEDAPAGEGPGSGEEPESGEPVYEISEEIDTEAVVVGCGAAGVMGCISLAQNGVSSYLIEKKGIGNASGASAGGPALAETPTQLEQDAWLPVQQLFDYEYKFSHGTVNALLLHRCIEQGPRVAANFLDNGVPMGLMKDSYGVGFRARHTFSGEAGFFSGAKRWQPVVDKYIELGGNVMTNTEGVKILTDENGAVCGLIAYLSEEDRYIQFNCKAVMIGCGGYLGNDARLKEHFGNITVFPLAGNAPDGKGYDMLVEAGAIADRNWALCCNEFGGTHPVLRGPNAVRSGNTAYPVYGQLLVNMNGDRFMNEQYQSDEALSIGGECCLREGIYYAVLDQEAFEAFNNAEVGRFGYYGSPAEWWAGSQSKNYVRNGADYLEADIANGFLCKADTLEEIAEYFNIPNLPATVATYNEMCEAGADTLFGKSAYLMKALKTPPYYVWQYYSSGWTTFGGVKTDDKCNCLTADMEKIPGLYAVGVDNGSLYTSPYYNNEGACFGLALGSGCVAADAIAEYVKAE